MRLLTLLVGVVGIVGSASAGDAEFTDLNRYDSSDYAAKLSYQVGFGGVTAVQPQSSWSFQVSNERASRLGAPALFRTDVGSTGVTRFALNGVDLREAYLLNQTRSGIFGSSMTTGGIIGLGVLALIVVSTAVVVIDDDDGCSPVGTGGALSC